MLDEAGFQRLPVEMQFSAFGADGYGKNDVIRNEFKFPVAEFPDPGVGGQRAAETPRRFQFETVGHDDTFLILPEMKEFPCESFEAAFGWISRFEIDPRPGRIAGEFVFENRPVIERRIRRPEFAAGTLPISVHHRNRMAEGVVRIGFVAPGREGVRGVLRITRIGQHGGVAAADDEAADVIVIVEFGVGAGFEGEKQPLRRGGTGNKSLEKV